MRIRIGNIDEYELVKKILSKGKHPTFIGKDLVKRCSLNGGLFFLRQNKIDIAVAIVNTRKNVLLVLNVLPEYRNKKMGQFLLNYIKPNFARVLESKVFWFEKQGYKKIGELKKGRSLNTQVMVRENLICLAGRIGRYFNAFTSNT